MEETLSFADDLGPLKVIQVQVPAVGLKAVLVVDNVARGPSVVRGAVSTRAQALRK